MWAEAEGVGNRAGAATQVTENSTPVSDAVVRVMLQAFVSCAVVVGADTSRSAGVAKIFNAVGGEVADRLNTLLSPLWRTFVEMSPGKT